MRRSTAGLLPSADPRAAEIIRTITEFENSVGCAEDALVGRDWAEVDRLLSDQHRLTHALANLLEETCDVRPAAFNGEVDRRIAEISLRREDQLQRLIAFNHLVKERLTVISRTREMRRVNVETEPAPRILDTLQ